eukprot:TRINITY_DN844_c0_g2_i1.p1 TRINITY_DN844_c0_g2~~TRINITY_DN844_c0_g2_i1.p1  ORF type:complete len:620 (+),score=261.07 TRINITY_DN844_c0_g2_i1:60-1919(+)
MPNNKKASGKANGNVHTNGMTAGPVETSSPTTTLIVSGNMGDVSDLTNLSQFFYNLTVSTLATTQDGVWVVLNLVVLSAARVLGLILLVLERFVTWMRARLDFFSPPEAGLKSAVNLGSGGFLDAYRPSYATLESLFLYKEYSQGGPQDMGNLDLAIYFAALSSAVYENNHWHRQYFSNWGFTRQRRVLNTNSCSATIVSRVVNNKLALFVVFKGTSPFDLNEWLTDANGDKTTTYLAAMQHGVYIPGEMHDGFFKAFTMRPDRTDESRPPLSVILQEISEEIAAHKDKHSNFNQDTDLRVWITGHSLGAALATVFTSFVAAAGDVQTPKPNGEQFGLVDAQKAGILPLLARSLVGVYTYGNPRVGNRTMTGYVNDTLAKLQIPFRRIRNGNDIVGAIPAGSGLFADVLHDFANSQDFKSPEKVSMLSNYGEIGDEFRLGYFGNVNEPKRIPEHNVLEAEKDSPVSYLWDAIKHVSFQILLRVVKSSCDIYWTFTNFALAWVGLFIAFVSLPNFIITKVSVAFGMQPLSAEDELTYEPNLVSFGLQTVTPSLIYDHVPANYIKHLYLLKSAPSEVLQKPGVKEGTAYIPMQTWTLYEASHVVESFLKWTSAVPHKEKAL